MGSRAGARYGQEEFGSIRVMGRRCFYEGLPLRECSLRKLVKEGTIPARYVGNRALLNWADIMDFMRSGASKQPQPSPPPQSGTIRPKIERPPPRKVKPAQKPQLEPVTTPPQAPSTTAPKAPSVAPQTPSKTAPKATTRSKRPEPQRPSLFEPRSSND